MGKKKKAKKSAKEAEQKAAAEERKARAAASSAQKSANSSLNKTKGINSSANSRAVVTRKLYKTNVITIGDLIGYANQQHSFSARGAISVLEKSKRYRPIYGNRGILALVNATISVLKLYLGFVKAIRYIRAAKTVADVAFLVAATVFNFTSIALFIQKIIGYLYRAIIKSVQKLAKQILATVLAFPVYYEFLYIDTIYYINSALDDGAAQLEEACLVGIDTLNLSDTLNNTSNWDNLNGSDIDQSDLTDLDLDDLINNGSNENFILNKKLNDLRNAHRKELLDSWLNAKNNIDNEIDDAKFEKQKILDDLRSDEDYDKISTYLDQTWESTQTLQKYFYDANPFENGADDEFSTGIISVGQETEDALLRAILNKRQDGLDVTRQNLVDATKKIFDTVKKELGDALNNLVYTEEIVFLFETKLEEMLNMYRNALDDVYVVFSPFLSDYYKANFGVGKQSLSDFIDTDVDFPSGLIEGAHKTPVKNYITDVFNDERTKVESYHTDSMFKLNDVINTIDYYTDLYDKIEYSVDKFYRDLYNAFVAAITTVELTVESLNYTTNLDPDLVNEMLKERVEDEIVNELKSRFKLVLLQDDLGKTKANSVKEILFRLHTEYQLKVIYELEGLEIYLHTVIDEEDVTGQPDLDQYMRDLITSEINAYTTKMLNPSREIQGWLNILTDQLRDYAKEGIV